jgi:hypothetical protein
VPRLIVDGMNVIGSVPDGWWRDRTAAMRRLLERLEPGTVLVLDGRERDLGDARGVDVRWAPVADDLIAEVARPGDTVVTSDRGLIERLPAECQVIPARTFRTGIDG